MQISIRDFHKIYKEKDKNVLLLDVRSEREFQTGHLDNSLNIPLDNLLKVKCTLPKHKKIITICLIGARSQTAADFLKKSGYNAFSLEGGIESWNDYLKSR